MIYSAGLAFALLGSALVFWTDWHDTFGLVKIAAALIGCIPLIAVLFHRRIYRTPLDWPVFTCAVALCWALWWSIDPRVSIEGVYSQAFYGLVPLLPALIIYYAVATEADDWPDGALICAALIAGANGIVCLIQKAGLGAGTPPWDDPATRALGLQGSPVFTAGLVAVCLPACIYLIRRGPLFLGLTGTLLGCAALVGCASRGACLAALAGLGAYWTAYSGVRPRWRWIGAACAILLGVLFASWSAGKLQSDLGRVAVWEIAWRAGLDRPLTGWGPDCFFLAMRQLRDASTVIRYTDWGFQASAHNDLLQAWATTGLPGLLAYAWLWGAVLLMIGRGARWGEHNAAIWGCVVAFAVVAKLNPTPPTAIYLLAALVGTYVAGTGREIWDGRELLGSIAARPLLVLSVCTGLSVVGMMLLVEHRASEGELLLRAGSLRRAADKIREANEIMPAHLHIAAKRLALILAVAKRADKGQQRDFLQRALRVAGRAVQAHPQDPSAYELLSTAQLAAAPVFGPMLYRDAYLSARRASQLDGWSAWGAGRLAQTAHLMHRLGEADEAMIRQRRIFRINRQRIDGYNRFRMPTIAAP